MIFEELEIEACTSKLLRDCHFQIRQGLFTLWRLRAIQTKGANSGALECIGWHLRDARDWLDLARRGSWDSTVEVFAAGYVEMYRGANLQPAAILGQTASSYHSLMRTLLLVSLRDLEGLVEWEEFPHVHELIEQIGEDEALAELAG